MSLHHEEEMSDESDENVISVPNPGSGQQVSEGWIVLNMDRLIILLCGSVVEWLCGRTCDQRVMGSRIPSATLGKLFTRASVTKQYNLVPANGR